MWVLDDQGIPNVFLCLLAIGSWTEWVDDWSLQHSTNLWKICSDIWFGLRHWLKFFCLYHNDPLILIYRGPAFTVTGGAKPSRIRYVQTMECNMALITFAKKWTWSYISSHLLFYHSYRSQAFEKIVCIQVRVDAVVALRQIVDAYSEDHLDEMKPHLPVLLDQLFKLMAEVILLSIWGRAFLAFNSMLDSPGNCKMSSYIGIVLLKCKRF